MLKSLSLRIIRLSVFLPPKTKSLGRGMARDYVRLATAYHMLSPTKVAVLKDLGEVRTSGGWEEFRRGDEASLPYWMALGLMREGLIELREPRVSEADVGRNLLVERGLRGKEFSSVRERFYVEVRELIKKLESEGNPQSYLRASKLRSSLVDFVRIRLRKMINAAFLSSKPEEMVDKLLPDERPLFLELATEIQEWVKEVTN